ncbi:hypothetical protein [Halegenticoccus tardaugens]|uniref:hypothetical protein n=1 Tax=Halegenticoccus tardaugens TaxID=2071624 RepID=UPI00100AD71F|nr:hypothetical protein [Halegenticoccus tardaugens]
MNESFTSKAKANLSEAMQGAARESAKDLVKEAVREANEESSSGRRCPGFLLLGVGVAAGYVLANRRLAASEFEDDEFEGEDPMTDIEVEAVEDAADESNSKRTLPRLLFLLASIAVGGYLLRKKRGGEIDETSDLADDVVSEVREVGEPTEAPDDGETNEGRFDETVDEDEAAADDQAASVDEPDEENAA